MGWQHIEYSKQNKQYVRNQGDDKHWGPIFTCCPDIIIYEHPLSLSKVLFFLRLYFFIFREQEREGEREREKHQCVVASHAPPTGDLACNPGMCPDWDSNHDHLVCSLALNPLSHTSQGKMLSFR